VEVHEAMLDVGKALDLIFNCTPKNTNFRDLLPEPPPPDAVPSCSEAGVMGVLPGLIGVL